MSGSQVEDGSSVGQLTRRDFIKLAGLGLGALAAGCTPEVPSYQQLDPILAPTQDQLSGIPLDKSQLALVDNAKVKNLDALETDVRHAANTDGLATVDMRVLGTSVKTDKGIQPYYWPIGQVSGGFGDKGIFFPNRASASAPLEWRKLFGEASPDGEAWRVGYPYTVNGVDYIRVVWQGEKDPQKNGFKDGANVLFFPTWPDTSLQPGVQPTATTIEAVTKQAIDKASSMPMNAADLRLIDFSLTTPTPGPDNQGGGAGNNNDQGGQVSDSSSDQSKNKVPQAVNAEQLTGNDLVVGGETFISGVRFKTADGKEFRLVSQLANIDATQVDVQAFSDCIQAIGIFVPNNNIVIKQFLLDDLDDATSDKIFMGGYGSNNEPYSFHGYSTRWGHAMNEDGALNISYAVAKAFMEQPNATAGGPQRVDSLFAGDLFIGVYYATLTTLPSDEGWVNIPGKKLQAAGLMDKRSIMTKPPFHVTYNL